MKQSTPIMTTPTEPTSSREFLHELKRLFVKEGAAAAVAYCDLFGAHKAEGLTGRDAATLEEIMHLADTAVELRAGEAHGAGSGAHSSATSELQAPHVFG